MSRRLNRLWFLLVFLVYGEVWALGLGDIKLDSALNQALLAEIELISATPDELANLTITVASVDTFARYGIDRPLFLSNINFTVIPSGRTDGNIVRVTSTEAVTEPFVTFLVEAVWSRGRLLREYTLLLDPPTFAPPLRAPVQQAVTAPTRAAPADSGRISRPEPTPEPVPRASAPRTRVQPASVQPRESTPPAPASQDPAPIQDSAPVQQSTSFDTGLAGDFSVQRGDTLWGIASRVREDNRLTINQMMLAIYEANPQAFAGNINILSAGATLRIPSADDVFRISRGDALSEVQRQHAAWGGTVGIPTSQPEPSLTLLPPDDDSLTADSGDLYDPGDLEPTLDSDQAASDARIRDIEQLLADHQDSLIEIGNNELTALRVELAELRGEELPLEPVAEEPELPLEEEPELPLEEEPDTSDIFADDTAIDEDVVADDTDAVAAEETPAPRVVSTRAQEEPGIFDSIIAAVTGIWGLIGGALLVVAGVLVWFAKRAASDDDEDSTGVWEALDADDHDSETFDSTARLRALAQEDESAIVVVEQEMEEPDATRFKPPVAPSVETEDVLADTGTNQSIEDTFSSDTAINLDQSDPVAEADFHMAYGLYDQAADLINGALAVEPARQDLLTKLCEIYFVWGNRDAFVDAATRLNNELSGDEDSEWDKIVIMGQQIAADHEMFADVTPGAATKAVDLSFEGGTEETSALDMDFAVDSGSLDDAGDDIIDLGAEEETLDGSVGEVSSIDFVFDEPDTGASVTQEMPPAALDEIAEEPEVAVELDDKTIESPTIESPEQESTVETPTIEQQFETLDPTGEMPSLGDADETTVATLDDNIPEDATAEIDLDDLGLDLESLAENGVSEFLESETEVLSDLDDTAESQTLKIDDLAATGKNPAVDTDGLIDDQLSATGRNPELADLVADEATGMHDVLDIDEALAATSEMPTIDDVTGKNPALVEDDLEDTDIGLDTSLLDATGQTQVLPEDFAVETGTGTDIQKALSEDEATMLSAGYSDSEDDSSDDVETMLAPLDDDDADGDFDFAKTEALPKDAFIGDMATDDTGVIPGLAAGSTDMDLDLDDLTAALKVSAVGDTVNQIRDDATVEQPRPNVALSEAEDDDSLTAAIAPEDLSVDLHDARTMTEVGTKLDLARAYVDMGDPSGARSILEEVLDEGDESQRQQAQQLLDSLPT